jgi:hypothetical protein
MNYQYKVTWTQPYYGWHECRQREIENQLAHSDFAEAKSIIARIMSL